MFIDFGNMKCPICGTSGHGKDNEMFSCPRCETSFSQYGVIVSPETEKEFELN